MNNKDNKKNNLKADCKEKEPLTEAPKVSAAELSAKEIEELKKKAGERDEYYDNWLRGRAECDNMRKRLEKEKFEHIKYANEDLILELIEILDNFERGIKSAEQKKDFTLLHQGVEMISKQLHKLLEERGLQRIKGVGAKFDPYKHEALEVVKGDPSKDGIIDAELQAGYELNGRVIRTAKVRVIKNDEPEAGEEEHKNGA
ncbi:MAG: nucleotide exchange factor GrpE [Candidatus Omnitrophica bacterium]|nr:nucleotide exchange factor GrpE [Candidatus Omnitrophota bacterium]